MGSIRTVLQPAKSPAKIGNHPLQIRQALTALGRLKDNKEDTGQVFEIIRALSGRTASRGYHRMLSLPEGARQAYLGDELSANLTDPTQLAGFALGTVGARYREFVGCAICPRTVLLTKAARSAIPMSMLPIPLHGTHAACVTSTISGMFSRGMAPIGSASCAS